MVGELLASKNAPPRKGRMVFFCFWRYENSEGVAPPIGSQFRHSGFGHTLYPDSSYRRVRHLRTLERWRLTGCTIVSIPDNLLTSEEYGKLFAYSKPPELGFYELPLFERLVNYCTFSTLPPRSGESTSFTFHPTQ